MKKFLSISLMLIVLCSSFVACQSSEPVVSQTEDTFATTITIQGLGDEDIVFTEEEVKSYPVFEAEVESTTSSGEIKTATIKGTLIADMLSDKGYDISDYESLKIVAVDGYEILVPVDVLSNRDIILAYEEDGEEYDQFGAFRSIVPDERAMYWVRGVNVLNFEGIVASSDMSQITFLDNLDKVVTLEDYVYYESVDKAVKISDLFDKYVDLGDATSGTLIASDGLEDDKDLDTLADGYLKLTGENAPLFTAVDMPKGMQIKEIVYLKTGDTCFASVLAMGGTADLQSVLTDSGISSATEYLAYDVNGEET